ncbi:sporulation protein YjcZ [Thalassomonas actiniarum]|uniref:Sporulation protein YjcZ n=1 Tax=Thalassomonas actiniarum TaxID=485447 RepID=A0AAE9YUY2_9GAMM|nr:sporulation protein YjcZ [Thalassomonas actiniarum]
MLCLSAGVYAGGGGGGGGGIAEGASVPVLHPLLYLLLVLGMAWYLKKTKK